MWSLAILREAIMITIFEVTSVLRLWSSNRAYTIGQTFLKFGWGGGFTKSNSNFQRSWSKIKHNLHTTINGLFPASHKLFHRFSWNSAWKTDIDLPSFPSVLQLKVSFGLLNNRPSLFDAMVDGCLGKRHFRLPVLLVPCRLTMLTQQTKGPIAEPAWIQISLMSISIQSSHLRLDIWFLKNFVFTVWGCSLTPNPQPGGPGYPSLSGSYPLTCQALLALPVAMLPPA
jgi:hypothetical protein